MYSNIVLDTHLRVPKKELTNIAALRRQFTIVSKYDSEVKIPVFEETTDWFSFPRYGLNLDLSKENVTDKRSTGQSIEIKLLSNLYSNQQDIMKQFETNVREGLTGFFMEAKPGTGKTHLGMAAIAELKTTTLIIVPKSDLLLQWKSRLLEFTDIKESDIGTASSGKCDWIGKKVVIGLVHTIAMDKWGDSFRNYFGCVIYDECDNSVPPSTFSPAASMFSAKYRIGMTASATRADGLHLVFKYHIAQIHLLCKPGNTMLPSVIVYKYSQFSGHVPDYINKMSQRGVLISKIADNPHRNQMIINMVSSCYNKERPVLVVSDRKQQLEIFKEGLLEKGIPEATIGFYVRSIEGKTVKKESLVKVADKCNIILGTYGMIKRGTDIKRLSVLIMATPQSDLRQTQGRIERFMEDKSNPVVIDIVDTLYPSLVSSYYSRLRFYNYNAMQLREVSV